MIKEEILKLEGVNVSTPGSGLTLLEDISFTVNKGDRLAIVGASGAGKTTLLRLLNRLINPSLGAIYFSDQEIRTIPSIQLRQQIVLVPQEPKLLGMTVKQALAYPLELQKLPAGEINHRLYTWIERLNLSEDWLERTELQLSLGQRQLVAIARALVMEPKILLLDEPTSALDAGKAAFLFQILRELANTHRTTILMVNHQLEWAQNFASRVLYLQTGKLLEDCLVEQIDWQKINNDFLQNEINQQFDFPS
jgi:D-methionine transport system ATP-binding protein